MRRFYVSGRHDVSRSTALFDQNVIQKEPT